jgi:hypothetical protein
MNLTSNLISENAHLNLTSKLWDCIINSIRNQNKQFINEIRPTIGVEIEFFVMDENGGAATLELSQNFLKKVLDLPSWHSSSDAAAGEFSINAVARELSGGRYSKLKYEYPPHLMEVAFAFFYNISDLFQELQIVFNDLRFAATEVGCILQFQPFLQPEKVVKIEPITKKIMQLNQSRLDFLHAAGIEPSQNIHLFPSFTASTQIHVGGIPWWIDESIVHRIYAIEASVPLFGPRLSCSKTDTPVELLAERTRLYEECFPGMKLVTFPRFEKWNFDTWLSGLLASPLASMTETSFSGKAYQEISLSDRPEISKILSSLRDLQYVRPRFIGTIEFRVDGSINCPRKIAALAAWRLGQSILANEQNQRFHCDFKNLRESWDIRRRTVTSLSDSKATQTIGDIIDVLRGRGFNEEKFVEDFL